MDAARNKPREGGFGQGKPFQKQKIGPKMEGALLWLAQLFVRDHLTVQSLASTMNLY